MLTDEPELIEESQIIDAEVLKTANQKKNKKKNEKSGDIHNIFDSVFRTIARYLKELIIPLINEAFKTAYPLDSKIEVKPNDHFTWGGVYITDLTIMLGGRLYHVECQSNPDGRMVIRIMYASFIALDNAHKNRDGSYTVDFPAAIYVPDACRFDYRSCHVSGT